MNYLTISYFRGEKKFSPLHSPISIGRSDSSDIQILDSCVSREHLKVSWDGRTWKVEDISSTGSYNPIGHKASHWNITSPTMLTLAHVDGPEITFYPPQRSSGENTAAESTFEPPSAVATTQVAEDLSSISFASSETDNEEWNPQISGRLEGKTLTLRVEVANTVYEFTEEAEVTIGRDPHATIRIEETYGAVSREHLKISRQNNRWVLQDLSSRGTFINQSQVAGPHALSKLKEIFLLGDALDGLPVEFSIDSP